MKKRVIAILVLTSLMLSSCSKNYEESTRGEEEATEKQTESTTQKQTEATTKAERLKLDYSHHTDSNEEKYKTILADPLKLKEGQPALIESTTKTWKVDPKFNGVWEKNKIWGYDVRGKDISGEDLSFLERIDDLSSDTEIGRASCRERWFR